MWLSTHNLKLLSCQKLSARYIGPFRIQRQVGRHTFRLQLLKVYQICPTFHVSLLKPMRYSPAHPSTEEAVPLPYTSQDGSRVYQVRAFLDSCRRAGTLQYIVDWEGFGPKEQSWVAGSDILDSSMIADFHRRHPSRPAPRPQGHS